MSIQNTPFSSYRLILSHPAFPSHACLQALRLSPLTFERAMLCQHAGPITDPLAIFTELVLVLCIVDLCDKFIEICLIDFQHVGIERAMSSSRPRILLRI